MSDLSHLRFFRTPPHQCSYLEEQQSSTIFVDPQAQLTEEIYSRLTLIGFRRSGDYLYRPHCDDCQACIPARVRVADFTHSRRHKRILKRNSNLTVEQMPATFTRESYALYAKYITERHCDGDMYPPSEEQFTSFLTCQWANTQFHCFREEGELRAIAVTDPLKDGLSAVYTFFDPAFSERSFGVMSLLWQIDQCRQQGLPYLYLGYWIRECQKMSYKQEYRPLEIFRNERWREHIPSDDQSGQS